MDNVLLNNQRKWTFSLLVAVLIVCCTTLLAVKPVSAKTIVLDFDTNTSTDIFGYSTSDFDTTPYGFTSMSRAEVIDGVLSAVIDDYLGYAYPSLPAGMELDINFEVGSIGVAPTNGDTDYSFIQIGEGTGSPTTGSLGHACLSCALVGDTFYSVGSVVGSIFTDNIASLAGFASDDLGLLHLIAGTTSHEIGHALSLPHPSGAELNPGESAFGLMATGAPPTSMPNSERVKDRAFSFTNFEALIAAVGLREIEEPGKPGEIPEPSILILLLSGLVILVRKNA